MTSQRLNNFQDCYQQPCTKGALSGSTGSSPSIRQLNQYFARCREQASTFNIRVCIPVLCTETLANNNFVPASTAHTNLLIITTPQKKVYYRHVHVSCGNGKLASLAAAISAAGLCWRWTSTISPTGCECSPSRLPGTSSNHQLGLRAVCHSRTRQPHEGSIRRDYGPSMVD